MDLPHYNQINPLIRADHIIHCVQEVLLYNDIGIKIGQDVLDIQYKVLVPDI